MPDPNSNPPVLAWTAAREAELKDLCQIDFSEAYGGIAENRESSVQFSKACAYDELASIAPALLAHSKRQAEAIRGLVGAVKDARAFYCIMHGDIDGSINATVTSPLGIALKLREIDNAAARALAAARELTGGYDE